MGYTNEKVTEIVRTYGSAFIERNLSDVIKDLAIDKSTFTKRGYTDLKLEIDTYDVYDNPRTELLLYGTREPTIKEITELANREKRKAEALEAQELATYERLRKKYGNGAV